MMKEPVFPQPEIAKEDREHPLVTLKPATLEDIDTLLELSRKVSDSQVYSTGTTREDEINELQKTTTYLIEKDGVVVGRIAYVIKSESHAYLSDLVVDPQYQGQGLGREALMHVLKELEQIERIDLVTHPDNSTALQLYLSLGFQVESKKEDYYGDGEPRLVLVKKRDSGKSVV